MEFVKLSVDDMADIKELFKSVFTGEPWYDDWSDEEQLDAYLMDLIGCFNSLSLGFKDENGLQAMALGRIKHWYRATEFMIDELCVRTKLQGQGIGGKFVEAVEEYLKANGVYGIFLLTDRNVPAYDFYKSHGFHEETTNVAFGKYLGKESEE